jgi:GTP-binding protein YchF
LVSAKISLATNGSANRRGIHATKWPPPAKGPARQRDALSCKRQASRAALETKGSSLAIELRNRRPAQRGQVHHLQRPHLGQSPGSELSLLHHRPQHRHRQFLGHIRSTDAICHVVRCFDDPEVVHVAGGVNPLHDIDIINTELLLADLDTVDKRAQRVEKLARNTQDAKIKSEASAVAKLKEVLDAGKPARTADLTDDERIAARDLFLITMKPQLYVANVDEVGLTTGNPYTEAVEKRAAEEGAQVVRICGALESEIAQLDPAERIEFLESVGLKEPGLNRLIHSAYRLLDLITYFTAGVQEVRAWTIKRGTKAPGAAGVIHSDFERGFIKADCYSSDDLFKYGSEQAVKEKGLLRSEGKEYVVKDGDILFFKFNV